MTTAACPKCRDEVTLPPAAPRAAHVRCPWCREEFELSELLDRMPPMLEIVRAPYGTMEDRREIGDEFPAADEDFQLSAAVEPAAGNSTFDFQGGAATATAAAPAVATRPRTAKTAAPGRPRRKEKSAVAEVIKVALGGVVGLFLAQLILWWLPEPYKRDPIELGPTVGKYVPWIVPAQYRPKRDAVGGEIGDGGLLDQRAASSANGQLASASHGSRSQQDTAGGAASPGSSFDSPGNGGAATSESLPTLPPLSLSPQGDPSETSPADTPELGAMPNDPLEIPEPDLSLDPAGDLALDPLATASPSGKAAPSTTPSPSEPTTPAESASPAPGALSESPSAQPDESEPLESERAQPPSAPESDQLAKVPDMPETADATPPEDRFVGVTDAPMYVLDEVNAAFEQTQTAQQALQAAEPTTASEAEQQLYVALTGLAEKLTYADVNDPKIDEIAKQVDELLSQGDVRARAKMILTQGAARLSEKKEDRPNSGVVLFGRVQSVQKQGALYETRLEMPSSSGLSVVPVYSKDDPQAKPGATIFVLGTLVDEPAKRLAGYSGALPEVIWMGKAAPLTR